MTKNAIKNLQKELKSQGWELIRFEQLKDPEHLSGMWIYRIRRENTPYAKVYGTGTWCESIGICIDSIHSDIRLDRERRRLKEGKSSSFHVESWMNQAQNEGYKFYPCEGGGFGVDFSEVEASNDMVLIECRIYREEIIDHLLSKAA